MIRRYRCLLALLLLATASFLLPGVHWRVIGWMRGEAFYQGRPTSYWKEEAQRYYQQTHSASRTDLVSRVMMFIQRSDNIPPFSYNSTDADPRAVYVLIELVQDEDDSVSWHAGDALRNLYDKAAPATDTMITMLNHENPIRRLNAVRTLAVIGSSARDAVRPLLHTLTKAGKSGWLTYEVVNALGNIGPDAREALPALLDLLHSEKEGRKPFLFGPSPRLDEAVAEALRKIDPEAVAQAGIK